MLWLWMIASVVIGASSDEASRLTRECRDLQAEACATLVSSEESFAIVSISAPPAVPQPVHFVFDKLQPMQFRRLSEFCESNKLGAFDCALLHRAVQADTLEDVSEDDACSAGDSALRRLSFLSTFPREALNHRGLPKPDAFAGDLGFSWTFAGASEGEAWNDLLSEIVSFEDRKSRVILDVGANVGDFTASLIHAGRPTKDKWIVYQFEPDPTEAKRLRIRAYDEGSTTVEVRVVEAAVGNGTANGFVTMYLPPEGGGGPHPHATLAASAHVWKHGSNSKEINKVREVSLDGYFSEREEFARVDVLKIDAEGADPLVLQGAEKILEKVDVLIFEYSHLWAGVSSLRKVIGTLGDAFDTYLIGNDGALIDLKCWSREYETWWWSNVIAVRSNTRPTLANTLRLREDLWTTKSLDNLIQSSTNKNCQTPLRPPSTKTFQAWKSTATEFAESNDFSRGGGCTDSQACVASLLLANLIQECTN